MDKSYVTLEQKMCFICGAEYDTGAILLNRKLAKVFDHKTTTSVGICPDCKGKIRSGLVAAIECDASKSGAGNGTNHQKIKLEDAYRTGQVVWIKASVWSKVFDTPVPEKGLCFIGEDAVKQIKSRLPPDEPLS